ncbi:MAG TPA: protein meaA, partial [Actinomycetota bacterium]|nr:protein meaA [Actinomycetota bacterium]
SMTINATAMWLLALYVTVAEEQGAHRSLLQGTTQNDILKEYLSRGTYIYPPGASMRLTVDMVIWTLHNTPRWNPINVCSYHLQEAGADPVLEIAYSLANAIAVLDATRQTGQVSPDDFERLVGRISFFCNAGMRIVDELCKMRAFTRLWDRITLERYGVQDPRYRRFRYGVQVNSLGLTASQPENNVYRILLEMLSVTLSKDARARAVQLPAWNEALGLPRRWDQQWSLRAQQILAFETDLLEHEDLFEGSTVVQARTDEIGQAADAELQKVLALGGSLASIDYMKEQLVAAHAGRRRAIESKEQMVVGVNGYEDTEPSGLVDPGASQDESFQTVDEDAEHSAIRNLMEWKSRRDEQQVKQALEALRSAAAADINLMEPSIAAARAGVTTGEWADALREIFGEFRAPTGVTDLSASSTSVSSGIEGARKSVASAAQRLGVGRLRLLIAKPGLDGHSNAAEQLAIRARDAGFEVIYQGIRLSIDQIARAAVEEDVHAIGVSILSGAHNFLVAELVARLGEMGVDIEKVPLIVGGVIPAADIERLQTAGVARVFTPLDYDLGAAVAEIADLIASRTG